MIKDYNCPICDSYKWQSVQKYVYLADDQTQRFPDRADKLVNLAHHFEEFVRSFVRNAPRPHTIGKHLINSYERRLREVLFEVWFPGQNEVRLASQYCGSCGFMTYTPRPDEKDLADKYRFLGERTQPEDMDDYNASLDRDPYAFASRRDLHDLVRAETGPSRLRVLDCGGASGWYLAPFVKEGCECELVDYLNGQIPGVKKVGDDIGELQGVEPYNVIVCRAVIEHLADPMATVALFHDLVVNNGLVYALVPCEIHAGIARLGYDPVTHINFFTPHSFSILFSRAGFDVVRTGMDEMSNIWVVARKRPEEASLPPDGPIDIKRYLYPGRRTTLRKFIVDRLRRSFSSRGIRS